MQHATAVLGEKAGETRIYQSIQRLEIKGGNWRKVRGSGLHVDWPFLVIFPSKPVFHYRSVLGFLKRRLAIRYTKEWRSTTLRVPWPSATVTTRNSPISCLPSSSAVKRSNQYTTSDIATIFTKISSALLAAIESHMEALSPAIFSPQRDANACNVRPPTWSDNRNNGQSRAWLANRSRADGHLPRQLSPEEPVPMCHLASCRDQDLGLLRWHWTLDVKHDATPFGGTAQQSNGTHSIRDLRARRNSLPCSWTKQHSPRPQTTATGRL